RRHSPESLFVIHSCAAFAREHFEQAQPEVARKLLLAAAQITGENFTAAHIEHFHRWRYARVENPLPLPRFRFLDTNRRLLFAGDAFGDPKIETAWLSGSEAAAALLGP
ncbi:MAG: hypothetical protein N2322_01965, partial [Terrimicrobiaceae bacterium]|nr:hypothetical protein [Terrimicrobiaceae bacterium]